MFSKLFPETTASVRKRQRRPLSGTDIEDTTGAEWGRVYLPREAEVNEHSSWMPPLSSRHPDGPVTADPITAEGQDYNGPTVLVLSSASKSLLESDFFRLGKQGQHLNGWTSGIVKVVQSRNPATQEPLGQYRIHFDTRAAATAYTDTVLRLLALSRASVGVGPAHAAASSAPRPLAPSGADDSTTAAADTAGVRAFTLIPPSAALDLKAERQYPPAGGADARDDRRVLLSLDGCHVSQGTLLAAVAEDGRERNLAWRLRADAEPLEPIAASGLREAPGEAGLDEAPRGLFARFVLSFEDAVEARRFATSWHKRELAFVDRTRTALVDATALW